MVGLEALEPEGGTLRIEAALVVGEEVLGTQAGEGVQPDEEGEVGEAFDEGLVVGLVLHEPAGDAQEEGGVAGRPDGDPVVGFGRWRGVLGRDGDDLGPALHGLDEEVGLGHLVLDQVLATLDVQPRVAQVVEVAVRGLQAGDEGMAGGLVTVPGVVGPHAPALGLLLVDAAHVNIEQRQHVGEAVHAVLADDAQQAHAATALEGTGAGAFHGLDHLLRIALGAQTLGALFARVAAGDGDHAAGDVVVSGVPVDGQQFVGAARIELVLGLVFGRQFGEAVIGPRLPALAHEGPLEAVGAVDAAVEGLPFLATAGVPVGGGGVAVEIAVALHVVVGLGAQDDAVADEGPQAAGVGVVGGANPGEGGVVTVLVAVELLPLPVRVACQRVVYVNGLEQAQLQAR